MIHAVEGGGAEGELHATSTMVVTSAARLARPRWWPGVLAWALWLASLLCLAAVPWLDELLRRAGRADLVQFVFPDVAIPVLTVPVVYLCENNLYSVSTPLTRQTRITHLAELAAAYGMASATVDGNNACAVYLAVREAVARARGGGGPTFVECLTYRQGGHKRDDPATYRAPEEVAAWMARDPLVRMRAALDQAGEAAAVARADKQAEAAIDDAVEFAASSPAAQADPA